MTDQIELLADPVWTDQFERERERVLAALDGVCSATISHVGSTAISEVPGKPALDVLVVVDPPSAIPDAVEALADADYEREHVAEREAVLLRRFDETPGTAVLKLHEPGDERIENQLLFREYLQENPDARRRYARVKREAAAEHGDDREAYTAAKADVVGEILDEARAEEADDDGSSESS